MNSAGFAGHRCRLAKVASYPGTSRNSFRVSLASGYNSTTTDPSVIALRPIQFNRDMAPMMGWMERCLSSRTQTGSEKPAVPTMPVRSLAPASPNAPSISTISKLPNGQRATSGKALPILSKLERGSYRTRVGIFPTRSSVRGSLTAEQDLYFKTKAYRGRFDQNSVNRGGFKSYPQA